jgi:hypothetical protein
VTGQGLIHGLPNLLPHRSLDKVTVTTKAILLLALGVTLFGVMDGLGKLLAGRVFVVQVVWARYAFAVPVILATRRPAAWPGLLRCERRAPGRRAGLLPLWRVPP